MVKRPFIINRGSLNERKQKMTKKTHLWLDDTVEVCGSTIVGVTIEAPDQKHSSLWYQLPLEYSHFLTKSCDAFVVATIFMAMLKSTDLIIHGEVSPSLLHNLEEFQAAWHCWLPDKYTKIEINADTEREQSTPIDSDKAVVAFSGGVDSCFTAYRHCRGTCGRLKRNLRAGVMVHGFDIPLNETDTFVLASGKSEKILKSLGMELIVMATNFRDLGDDWCDAHICGLVSSLMLLQGGYSAGLIAGGPTYDNMSTTSPWGSNPVTDWMLSSDSFQTIHDGAAFTRAEKIHEIENWPEALKNLRVCWEGEQKDRNCGRCEKCIRNIMNFRALGLDLPECFEQDITDSQIAAIEIPTMLHLVVYTKILLAAKDASITDSWVTTLENCIEQNRRALNGSGNLWRQLRKTIALRTRVRRLMKVSPEVALAETAAKK